MATQFARSLEAELVLCYVFEPLVGLAWAPRSTARRDIRADRLKQVRKRLTAIEVIVRRSHLRTVSVVTTGQPAGAIVRLARQRKVDLVILGSHGRKGLKRMALGSVAESVVLRAPCAVLVIRSVRSG